MLYCNNNKFYSSILETANHAVLQNLFLVEMFTGDLRKLEYSEKVDFSCNLFQKVKLSYILESSHVK